MDDRHEIFQLRSDENVNRFLGRAKSENIEEATEFIRKINEGVDKSQSMYWAVAFKNKFQLLGTICLWNFSHDDTVAEIGFELLPEFQGQGIMQEAIHCVIKFGFEKILLMRIEAETHGDNARSIKLLEKNNFIPDPQTSAEDDTLKRFYVLNPKKPDVNSNVSSQK